MSTDTSALSGTCRNGHPRTPENTYFPAGRPPSCRVCNRLASLRSQGKIIGPMPKPVSNFPTDIKELFAYSEESPTGVVWIFTTSHRSQAGSTAGSLSGNGYYLIRHRDKNLACHRIVWELHNGPIQEGMLVDHINGNKADNRIENLRLATKAQNGQNQGLQRHSTTGVKGLTFSNRVWQGQIRCNGVRYGFASKNRHEVEAWLIEKRNQLHGEYAKHD